MSSSEYNLRIIILRRSVPTRAGNNEPVPVWNAATTGGRFSAKRLTMDAGEQIQQGLKDGLSFLKLEIKGQKIPVAFDDRIQLAVSGQLYRVSADPVRAERSTIITCESLHRVTS